MVHGLAPNFKGSTSRSNMRLILPKVAAELAGTVQQVLNTAEAVSISVDGWSSSGHSKALGITSQAVLPGGILERVTLHFNVVEAETEAGVAASSGADVVASIISTVLTSWNIKDSRCLSITNDTASDAKAAAALVAADVLASCGAVLECVDCGSHVTSLCAKDGGKWGGHR